MKTMNRYFSATRSHSLSSLMLALLTMSAALPVVAAPADPLAEPQAMASNQVDQTTGSLYEYLWIVGSAFHPLDNTTTYAYPGKGCISKTGGTSNLFAHKAVLPQGAEVRYLRLYYYDASSSSSVIAFLTTYDAVGNFNERISIASEDRIDGYGTTLSTELSYEVDHFNTSINVVANLGDANNNTLKFCGVRIAYYPPSNDVIFANGFELISF